MIELCECSQRRFGITFLRLRIWQQDRHGDDAFRAKSRIDREQPLKTSAEQTGADQQHQGQRDLRDDKQIARSCLRTRTAATGVLQIVLQLAARGVNDRHEAERNRDHQGDGKAEQEHARADADLADTREIAVIKTDDQLHAPRGQQRAETTPPQG